MNGLADGGSFERWWHEHSELDRLVGDAEAALETGRFQAAEGALASLADALEDHFASRSSPRTTRRLCAVPASVTGSSVSAWTRCEASSRRASSKRRVARSARRSRCFARTRPKRRSSCRSSRRSRERSRRGPAVLSRDVPADQRPLPVSADGLALRMTAVMYHAGQSGRCSVHAAEVECSVGIPMIASGRSTSS